MAKKSRKKRKEQKKPQVSSLTMLRPHLDRLFEPSSFQEKSDEQVKAALSELAQDIKPGAALPVLLLATRAADPAVRERLDSLLPGWLQERDDIGELRTLVEQYRLEGEEREHALQWLEAGNVDLASIRENDESSLFFRAYRFNDEFQGCLLLLFYTDPTRKRAQGFQFLFDLNPPWEGGIKDFVLSRVGAPRDVDQTMTSFWERRDTALEALIERDIKRELLERLLINRRENIQMPEDLIPLRDTFLRVVLPLKDGPNTPSFTAEDFDILATQGRPTEALRHQEQQFGFRTRMSSGQEVIILKGDDGDF